MRHHFFKIVSITVSPPPRKGDYITTPLVTPKFILPDSEQDRTMPKMPDPGSINTPQPYLGQHIQLTYTKAKPLFTLVRKNIPQITVDLEITGGHLGPGRIIGLSAYSQSRQQNYRIIAVPKGIPMIEASAEHFTALSLPIDRTHALIKDPALACDGICAELADKYTLTIYELGKKILPTKSIDVSPPQHLHVKDSQNRLLRLEYKWTIGEGNFGQVGLYVDTNTGTKFAVKTLRSNNQNLAQQMTVSEKHPQASLSHNHAYQSLKQEAELGKTLNQSNIGEHRWAQYLAAGLYRDYALKLYFPFIVLPFYEEGTLENLIRSTTLVPKNCLEFSHHLTTTLHTLHHDPFSIHLRDIHSNNTMMIPSGNQRLPILIDFGLARPASEDHIIGTHRHRSIIAPELLSPFPTYSAEKEDIWALGAMFAESFIRERPFQQTYSFTSPKPNGEYHAYLQRHLIRPAQVETAQLLKMMWLLSPNEPRFSDACHMTCDLDLFRSHLLLFRPDVKPNDDSFLEFSEMVFHCLQLNPDNRHLTIHRSESSC